MIHQYLRDSKNQKKGVVIGVSKGNMFAVGFSMANVKKGDKFDKDKGLRMAQGRAEKILGVLEGKDIKETTTGLEIAIPDSMVKQVSSFAERSKRYFKDKTPVSRIIKESDIINSKEANRLEQIIQSNADVEPISFKPIDEYRPTDIQRTPLSAPAGTNGLFIQVGRDTLVVYKENNKWGVKQV